MLYEVITVDELRPYDLVILSDVSARRVGGAQREAILRRIAEPELHGLPKGLAAPADRA